MASFDRIDGLFVASCSFEERKIFKNAGWLFNTSMKRWTTSDFEVARSLVEYAIGDAKHHIENAVAIREAAYSASWAEKTDNQFSAPKGLQYLEFQKAGIEYALGRKKTLIADPPGLGKTIQAIGVHNASVCNRVLIICPASLKDNWKAEWERWDCHNLSVEIAGSTTTIEKYDKFSKSVTNYIWPDTNVVIINYDMLDQFDDNVKNTSWDLLIVDESHLLKTPTTLRTLCVLGGNRKAKKVEGKIVRKAKSYSPIKAKRSLFLTGTPIMSKPVELWTIVKACDPDGLGKSWEKFVYTYCDAFQDSFGLDVSGASNLKELNRLLRERFMVRRDKESVLKDLPGKIRELVLLPQDKLRRPLKKELSIVDKALASYEKMLGLEPRADFSFLDAIDDLSEKIQRALAEQDGEEPDWNAAIKTLSEPDQILFTEISRAREEVALAKVPLVIDHVQKLIDSGEPVILFAHHKSVIAELTEAFSASGISNKVITGSVPVKKRQPIVDAFQNGEFDLIIGNITAMGVGFTLHRSHIVVFAELDWVPALIEQAEDRAWRIGQRNYVLVQHLVVNGSIEARMANALLVKMGIIFDALDQIAA